ncbi:MAG TPA: methyltransferase domain-containing protein [Candidatus Solibacter sp.]|jgi:tRNA (mo5U34)-methyltransferase|nr:methyltransferase domain-containing protein [Candidatus Solibacter sp.]
MLTAGEVRTVEPPRMQLKSRDLEEAISFFQPSQNGAATGAPRKPQAGPDANPELVERVGQMTWYHTLELPGGVVTPGEFDHRQLVPNYGIPADLTGKRALDVGTFDGFWAFEFERRGAAVTAVDVPRASMFDFPGPARQLLEQRGVDLGLGSGFRLAREAYGSRVERLEQAVYDIDPGRMGTFDLVHMGDLLLHLERPIEALRRLRSVTKGFALIADVYQPDLETDDGRQLVEYRGGWEIVTWYLPSLSALGQMVLDAGFADVRVQYAYQLARTVPGHGYHHAVLAATP